MKLIDLSGAKFSRLTVVGRADVKSLHPMWNVVCDCGSKRTVSGSHLRTGRTKSCGCLNKQSRPTKDISSKRYGRTTAIYSSGEMRGGKSLWLCKCDCGNEHIASVSDLSSGNTRSCGCLQKDTAKVTNRTHGMRIAPEYRVWSNMKQRCSNPKSSMFDRYGARGIKVCDRWMSFHNFISDMGKRPPGASIERIDNNGNYEPSNCRWATKEEQVRNTSRNRLVEIDGAKKCVADWCDIFGIRRDAVYLRISRGWDVELAIKTPMRAW